ncbi:PREDICTED: UDP-glycosyltransferase 90A1-like [Camelina sativa]|uniref:Glycosyltransferase n=1 Tax=Camelina sativa TaxID=90675 RepID=A0ABM0T2Z4_CAMSA|nr:PREDICTED: UDP-glycosyltransferase 90A1-like [Camelina sativa]
MQRMRKMNVSSSHHVVLFPYMSKGHTIPLLQFARLLLLHRRIAPGDDEEKQPTISVTVFTTPKNQPFVSNFLSDDVASSVRVISLPFPENIVGIPPGVESTDKLPSMSLYAPFTRATKSLQPLFEAALQNLPKVSFMVTDGFLWWTSESAARFDIPRLAFYGMNSYASAITSSAWVHELFTKPENVISDTEPVTVPDFPWISVKKCQFDPVLTNSEQSGPAFELLIDHIISTKKSRGVIVNSFYELESTFVDYRFRDDHEPKPWCVGPLCLANPPKPESDKPDWIDWLDRKREKGHPVLYVAFGTQAEISNEQLNEIALGLEESKVNFLWVTRKDLNDEVTESGLGLEKRVKENGLIVRDWVDQWEILSHESVKGFLSHCGWNSAQESICAGIPLLAWPMMAEQPLNAKLVVEELKIGVGIETEDGSVKGLVRKEELSRKVKELMEGEMGETARKNVIEYAEMAKKALAPETGSSWKNLNSLLEELCKSREADDVSELSSDKQRD